MVDPTEPRVTVTDEMVEEVLLAWFESAPEGATRENVHPRILDRNRPRAAAALEAAAPLIAAQALRDFAASMDSKEWGHQDDWGVNCAYAFEVLARADQIEGEQR